jgi:phospholipase C
MNVGSFLTSVRGAFARVAGFARGLIDSLRGRPRPVQTGLIEIEIDESVEALAQIEHFVVLMLENRSFDHMLGHLSLVGDRGDVDGLEAGMANEHDGQTVPVYRLSSTSLVAEQDPCHSGECVDEQLAGGNAGFVANFVRTRPDPKFAREAIVMGYFDGEQLPAYDFLARHSCVCDRWFCSVRGATFPNRLYAAAGRAAGSRNNASPPTYDLPTFVRHLDDAGASWRWYSAEPFPTIWALDRSYLPRTFDNVRPFSSPFTEEDFFSSARNGRLPNVAWIDPDFVDVGGPVGSNDDHPPADVRAGQELVLRIFNALARSPAWERTLFLVTYDEHGGFYDHVRPSAAPDDLPAFRVFGPRVPALVASSRLGTRVSHELFDHTSIIKTFLVRFCRHDERFIPDMGRRVSAAHHLGVLLGDTPRPAPDRESMEQVASALGNWRRDALRAELEAQSAGLQPEPESLTDFQKDYLAARDAVLASLSPDERATRTCVRDHVGQPAVNAARGLVFRAEQYESWRYDPSMTLIPGGGYYAFHMGGTFSDVIVFEAAPVAALSRG